MKAKKLHPWHLELIRQRGEIIKRGLELNLARRKLDYLVGPGQSGFAEASGAWDAELACLLDEVDRQLKVVSEANEPVILPEDCDDRGTKPGAAHLVDHLGEPTDVSPPKKPGSSRSPAAT